MQLTQIRKNIPEELFRILQTDYTKLRPAQEKAIKQGLLEGKNMLICTPTASGKTLIAELAALKAILNREGKAVYIVPLKALASEKYKEFRRKYGNVCKVGISIGDFDSSDSYLANYDLVIVTSEKLDSLIRHRADWIRDVAVIIVDEIHLMNDAGRGPTLEILITILRQLLNRIQIVALSATIGNPKELAEWLDAELVEDNWRPVKLEKGIAFGNEVVFE